MGTFTNKVDAKSRVSVPAEFRAILSEEQHDGIICFPSFTDQCLEGGGPQLFESLQSMIEQLDPYDPVRDAFEVSIIGDCQRLFFDREGRITLTGAFSKHADIADYVTFVGRGEKFQMWNPVVYEDYRYKARQLARENRGLLQRRRGEDR
jgi:MraZ protein